MLTSILQCIVLSHFNTGQEPFYQQSADRYNYLQSIVLPLFNTDQEPFYQQNADRYICRVLSYLFSIQVKHIIFTNRMLTGILLQSIVLPLFNTDQEPFYQQNADRYIAVYCLTSFHYRSTHFTNRMLTGILQSIVLPLFNTGQTHFTYRMLAGILLYAVLSLCYYRSKDPFLSFFTSLIISPTD